MVWREKVSEWKPPPTHANKVGGIWAGKGLFEVCARKMQTNYSSWMGPLNLSTSFEYSAVVTEKANETF